jgi:hypothetical protein
MAKTNSKDWRWKLHTPNILHEIAQHSGQPILVKPLQLFGSLLFDVATRAAELNDPRLNDLMCRLTLYEIADPEKPGYDPARVKEIAKAAKHAGRTPKI